ncbi:hypothetical protein ACED32_23305 [Vibrio bivalvicida]|uniref:hypothetical protein n=1 Tax=Vibrio bivalvicida TaxID=1276888 RepID=UPI00352CF0FC
MFFSLKISSASDKSNSAVAEIPTTKVSVQSIGIILSLSDVLKFFYDATNAVLSGEQRTTTLNKATLISAREFATKTAER